MFFVVGNVDFGKDTPDGKNTIHTLLHTAMKIYNIVCKAITPSNISHSFHVFSFGEKKTTALPGVSQPFTSAFYGTGS